MADPQQTWKIIVAYDGTDYQGWQIQPDQPTIQGELSDAIERITGERTLPQGSGRTDAGVHAAGQVASFTLRAPIPSPNLLRALNRALPSAIRVLSAEVARPEFHARHDAVGKTYEYRIYRGEICPPWLARYVYALNWPLNLAAMQEAATLVIGEHDFTSFAACDADLSNRRAPGTVAADNVRTIYDSDWKSEGDLLLYRVAGSGFLHHMVRNLVGAFLDVGRGNLKAKSIPEILAAKARIEAGPTAPARGLILVEVRYKDNSGSPDLGKRPR